MTLEEKTARDISAQIWSALSSVLCSGLEPKRVYMNMNTREDLFRGLDARKTIPVTVCKNKKETIYGVQICVSNDLEDGEIDISVKQ